MLPVQNLQPRENEILRRNARTETHVRIVDRSRNYREGTPGSEEQRHWHSCGRLGKRAQENTKK